MPTRRVRLTVEVVVDDDNGGVLHGRIGCNGASSSDFTGWLGLLSGLDHLLAAPGPDSADGSDANIPP